MKTKGITLIELLVSIVVSGIVLSAVMMSYASLVRMNRKINITRQLQKEINFSLIRISDRIRSESVSFSSYLSGNGALCENNTIDSSENLCTENTEFEFINDNLLMNGSPLFSKQFIVSTVLFSVTPSKDPSLLQNLGDPNIQLQPKVTIFLDVESKETSDINFQIQTTISSRKYE